VFVIASKKIRRPCVFTFFRAVSYLKKIRFVSKGEGEVVPVIWAREHEEVWGLHEFLSFAVNEGNYVLGEFLFPFLL